MDVAILSDTHIPSRAPAIPAPFREQVAAADYVIHAGDVVSADALGDLRALATESTVVSGNMDRDLGLPEVAAVDLAGATFVVTHGTGPPAGYEERIIRAVQERDGDVGVAGHTHEVADRRRAGLRVLNPGSATGAAPASVATMMTATVTDGSLAVTLHER